MSCKRASKMEVCVFCRCIGMRGRSKREVKRQFSYSTSCQSINWCCKIAIQRREKIQSTSLNKMMFASISVPWHFLIRGQTKQQLAFRVPVVHLSYVVQTCLNMRLLSRWLVQSTINIWCQETLYILLRLQISVNVIPVCENEIRVLNSFLSNTTSVHKTWQYCEHQV
jgi:hypothetical protein